MGRPNLSEEKREQILDAFEHVILRDGFAKASQRRIAQEAGMNQPMILHYFSSSEELLDSLLDRVIHRYKSAFDKFLASQNNVGLEEMISFMCSKDFHQISQQNEVFFALIGQVGHKEEVFSKMTMVYQQFLLEITTHLEAAQVPNADKVSYMVMCFVIGHDWAKKLGFGEAKNEYVEQFLFKNIMGS